MISYSTHFNRSRLLLAWKLMYYENASILLNVLQNFKMQKEENNNILNANGSDSKEMEYFV